MNIEKIAVIGSGDMGHGIAEIFAMAGYSVSMMDISDEALKKAIKNISESLEKFVKKGKITQEQSNLILERISSYTEIEKAVKDADLVIEAVPEIISLKNKIFQQLDQYTKKDAILGSNTSNIRITEIAKNVSDPKRVVGIHFFNPPILMKLVEIIKGDNTSDTTMDMVAEIAKKIGKTGVKVNKDSPGFIVNRINAPDMLFFCLLQDYHIASPEEIDAFGKMQGLPMGPYELLDFVGIDVVYDSLQYYAKELSPGYLKCHVFKDLVDKKMLGKKTGKGFYDWSAGRPHIDTNKSTNKVNLLDLFAIEINESIKILQEGIAMPQDIETAVKLGLNRPFGPITIAKSLTNAEVKAKLESLSKQFDCKVFEPAEAIMQGKMREAIDGRLYQAAKKEEKKETKAEPIKAQGSEAFNTLILERFEEKVLRIIINKPKHNTINEEVLDDLNKVIDSLWYDNTVNVILITGQGSTFSAGAELTSYFPTALYFLEFTRKGERIFRRLSEIPKITIASLKGYALGGGLELAMACDIRVATEDVKLGMPEVTLGLIPAWGGSQRLAKLVGMSKALQLVLTGERITGKDAYEIGLIAKIFKDIDNESLSYAKEIAVASAPISAALAKRLINKGAEAGMDTGLEMESFAAGIVYNTEDLKEGIMAMLSKKKPEFKGK
jgi:enoyl-CoA hydratase/3-hydroxyacyl-CoA dehydrogenase